MGWLQNRVTVSQSCIGFYIMTKLPHVLLSESSVQCGEAGQRQTGLLLEEGTKEKYTISFRFVWQNVSSTLLLLLQDSTVILWKYRACHQRRISSMVLVLHNFLNTQGLIILKRINKMKSAVCSACSNTRPSASFCTHSPSVTTFLISHIQKYDSFFT